MQAVMMAAVLLVFLFGGIEVAWSQSAGSRLRAIERQNARRDFSDREKEKERNRSANADAHLKAKELKEMRRQVEKERKSGEPTLKATQKGRAVPPPPAVKAPPDSSPVKSPRQQRVTRRGTQRVTLADLKRVPRRPEWDTGDAFLVQQRDGTLMLVDPKLAQQVR